MRLSTKGRYSVTAMLDLAIHDKAGPVTLADISQCQGISLSYLEQLFARLRKSGLVKGVRGPGGGYRLARPASEISIAEIICSVDENVDAFKLDLHKETKKTHEEQNYPIYIAEKEGKTFYIVPLYGAGLWDAIWGYIALESDKNTIIGASFDHAGETPGLGAEINQSWYEDQYIGKTIFDENNNFVSVKAVKGGAKVGDMHGVDAISGGTITSDGVSMMVEERLKNYVPYLKNN